MVGKMRWLSGTTVLLLPLLRAHVAVGEELEEEKCPVDISGFTMEYVALAPGPKNNFVNFSTPTHACQLRATAGGLCDW